MMNIEVTKKQENFMYMAIHKCPKMVKGLTTDALSQLLYIP